MRPGAGCAPGAEVRDGSLCCALCAVEHLRGAQGCHGGEGARRWICTAWVELCWLHVHSMARDCGHWHKFRSTRARQAGAGSLQLCTCMGAIRAAPAGRL